MSKRLFKTMVALLAIAFAWQANAMEVYIHYTNGTWPSGTTSLNGSGNLTLEMEASDSFENLKAKIEDKSGLNPDFITLSYGTYDNLPDDGTLYQYGITSGGTTLNMSYNPPTHTVRMAEGTEEAANWTLASGNASVPGNQVLQNVMAGDSLVATYNGTKKVKSVKAVKYVAPAATVTTAPTATGAIIEVGSTAALVNAGAAIGGTMMYAVTTTNVQPASTADFSATIPTAEGRTAGTYYVWYYAKADAEHSDSEIAGPVSVTLAEPAPAYYSNMTSCGSNSDEQINTLKLLGRGYQAYNSSLTAAQAWELAKYRATVDGMTTYVVMSSQDEGYEIHYVVSTDVAATEHVSDLYDLIDYGSSTILNMYYVAQ